MSSSSNQSSIAPLNQPHPGQAPPPPSAQHHASLAGDQHEGEDRDREEHGPQDPRRWPHCSPPGSDDSEPPSFNLGRATRRSTVNSDVWITVYTFLSRSMRRTDRP